MGVSTMVVTPAQDQLNYLVSPEACSVGTVCLHLKKGKVHMQVEWGWVVEWTYLFFSLEVLGCEWEVCGCARNSTIGTGDKQCQLDFVQLHAVWEWGYMVGFRC